MMHALRYEPRLQRQRFEPREQQRTERGEQDRHIHLHIHLDLTFRGKQRHVFHSNALHVTRIFAALVAATVLFVFTFSFMGTPFQSPFTLLFSSLMYLCLLLAWVATWLGGLPLLISAWRSTPRVRFLLALPFLPILLTIFFLSLGGPMIGNVLQALGLQSQFGGQLFWCVLVGYPLISMLLLTRAIRQATLPDKWFRIAYWLSFVVIGGLVLALLWALLWSLSLLLVVPAVLFAWQFWLPIVGIALAVIFATSTLFSWFRSRGRTQASPKDASPFDAG
jgi:hypothetical protein